MNEMIEMLGKLSEDIGGDWKNIVLIDNKTENPLVDAYNEGVTAMARQCIGMIQAIILGKQIQADGHTVTIEKVGEE